METTFITIHDLSPEARILYCSDSIVDILGYSPGQVYNKSCWEFFHPSELPTAQAKHGRGVELDRAAVICYARMKDNKGQWVGCEIIFTIVYDVMVGCTSIYRQGKKSAKRAMEAPVIRRLFSNSPRDPRYHMLSHLSAKFTLPPQTGKHEPRAALFLNRYTRTLTIMYATNGLADILGVNGEELRGKSFYYCIAENCLQDAVRCLENAKENDSIAYLRFRYRNPRQDELLEAAAEGTDEDVEDDQSNESDHNNRALRSASSESAPTTVTSPQVSDLSSPMDIEHTGSQILSNGNSNSSSNVTANGDQSQRQNSISFSPESSTSGQYPATSTDGIELEAVVSCTSDGLVVCLRLAQPVPASPVQDLAIAGVFHSPWSNTPYSKPPAHPPTSSNPSSASPFEANGILTGESSSPAQHSQPTTATATPSPPPTFMDTIRECAVFTWGVAAINGSLTYYSRGRPSGEALPPAGLPIWDADKTLSDAHASGAGFGHANGVRPGSSRGTAHKPPNGSP